MKLVFYKAKKLNIGKGKKVKKIKKGTKMKDTGYKKEGEETAERGKHKQW